MHVPFFERSKIKSFLFRELRESDELLNFLVNAKRIGLGPFEIIFFLLMCNAYFRRITAAGGLDLFKKKKKAATKLDWDYYCF